MASKKPPQAALAAKSPTSLHIGLAEYITDQTGYAADALSVSLAARLNNQYRASTNYTKAKAARVNDKSKAVEERAKAAKVKLAERARKLREQAEALEAKAGVKPARKPRTRKPANLIVPVAGESDAAREAREKRAAAKAKLSVVPDVDPSVDVFEGTTNSGPPDDEFVDPDVTDVDGGTVTLPAVNDDAAQGGPVFEAVDDDEDDDF